MASRSTELNRYHKVSASIKFISADIKFLKTCKFNRIFPNFISVKVSNNCQFLDKVTQIAKLKWLELEIKRLYSKRSLLELEGYSLYKKLTFNLNSLEFEQWCEYQRKMFEIINSKLKKKFAIQNRKLLKLGLFEKLTRKNVAPRILENIVENHSSKTFDNKELNLLNKGLKFSIPDSRPNLEDVVASIESTIQKLDDTTKNSIRDSCKRKIRDNINKFTSFPNLNKEHKKTIKSLREKDCFYLKADKGNKLVILDKEDYYERVNRLIDNGPYSRIKKNPISKMITQVNNSFKFCHNLITPYLRRKLHVSNPSVPKLYCLPKIHKPGKSMRPIVAAMGSPTYQLSKWLTNEFNALPVKQPSFSVKNSLEFINKIKDLELLEGEILASFDVCSLFPSVPVTQTLIYLRELLTLNSFSADIIDEYVHLTRLCMSQNVFQFKKEFFEQLEGTAMGNSLSPFMADLFMSRFETDLQKESKYFPRVWLRYVDDVFVIFNTQSCDIEQFLENMNSRFRSIKFTYEIEKSEQLPFLDTLVIRNNNKLDFDIYRKDTNTDRYITADSFNCPQHKNASFNFLIHRLFNFPLSKERFNNELRKIKNIARSNGFDSELIDKLVKKNRFKQMLSNSSTFQQEGSKNSKFAKIPFEPRLTRGLPSIFKNFGFQVAYSSSNNLRKLLGNPKDKVEQIEKSGIYEISCSDCDNKYVGQSRRPILKRFKEHLACLRLGNIDKSAVAQHIFNHNHKIDVKNLKLVKSVSTPYMLDSLESIEILKTGNNAMNNDKGPIPYSTLYSLLKD